MVRRLGILLAMVLAGCDSVSILTSPPGRPCYLNVATGTLVADPTYGTRIEAGAGWTLPVMWPHGFRARRAGSEVEVLDEDGRVVAVTGRRYNLSGAQGSSAEAGTVWAGCAPTPAGPP